MRKRVTRFAAPVVSALILIAGCDSGGITEGVPKDAPTGGTLPPMPGELKSTKDIAKQSKSSTLPPMPGATPAPTK